MSDDTKATFNDPESKWAKQESGFDSRALKVLEKANSTVKIAMSGRITELLEQARAELRNVKT